MIYEWWMNEEWSVVRRSICIRNIVSVWQQWYSTSIVLSSFSQMVKHRRLAHGAKTFICTICEKGFTSIFALNKHLNVHSGLKPFKCIDCDYRFVDPFLTSAMFLSLFQVYSHYKHERFFYLCPNRSGCFQLKHGHRSFGMSENWSFLMNWAGSGSNSLWLVIRTIFEWYAR